MADTMKSKVVAITNAGVELLGGPASAGDTTVITMLQVGNIHASSNGVLTLELNKNGAGAVAIMDNIAVDNGKAAIIYSDANGKLILENLGTADSLRASADADSVLVATISYIERTA